MQIPSKGWEISFPIYLLHYLILMKIKIYISNMWIKGLVLIVVTMTLSILINKYIEEPLKRFAKLGLTLKNR